MWLYNYKARLYKPHGRGFVIKPRGGSQQCPRGKWPKHRKKYWRKHSDVKDVEEAVAEKRREEVFG